MRTAHRGDIRYSRDSQVVFQKMVISDQDFVKKHPFPMKFLKNFLTK